MKIPDFDDKDLAMVCITILGLAGLITGLFLKADATALFSFVGLGITGLCALATGRKKIETKPIQDL